MIKRVPSCLLFLAILQILSTFLIALALYFFLYPSFFAFIYPNSPSLNLLWLFLLTPFIFEAFLLIKSLYTRSEDILELFSVRLFFGMCVKSLYVFVNLLTTKAITLTQARLFYTFLLCVLLDGLKAYLLLHFRKRRSS